MGQPGMRITVDAAMRARDVSRPKPDGEKAPGADRGSGNGQVSGPEPGSGPGSGTNGPAEPARRTKAAKNERRRLGKRGGARKPSPPNET
ncbi:hypothetical protein ETD83_17850 [Actinomadura soli]|uniref:Uncharacterized protein n=1 Tax=Actinomadura soli TaxID=2508997 RepID=A0A5C4JB62_9ACTN|nr:hypothetical protein [Actinomadura soli]TMQ99903.1 hypothetical protein ETD83_17850 [Actinomadura soli]